MNSHSWIILVVTVLSLAGSVAALIAFRLVSRNGRAATIAAGIFWSLALIINESIHANSTAAFNEKTGSNLSTADCWTFVGFGAITLVFWMIVVLARIHNRVENPGHHASTNLGMSSF